MDRPDRPLKWKPATHTHPQPNWPSVGNTPTEDEFATWCEDPVTRFVTTAFLRMAEEQRRAWEAASWLGGEANEKLLIELRTRADAYAAIYQTTWEQYVGAIKPHSR
jgi:hypothetical protein